MVEGPFAKSDDISEVVMAPVFINLELIVRGGHGNEGKVQQLVRLTDVYRNDDWQIWRSSRRSKQSLCNEVFVRFSHDQEHVIVRSVRSLDDCTDRLRVEVVGIIVLR